jgi:hypothetical protein
MMVPAAHHHQAGHFQLDLSHHCVPPGKSVWGHFQIDLSHCVVNQTMYLNHAQTQRRSLQDVRYRPHRAAENY